MALHQGFQHVLRCIISSGLFVFPTLSSLQNTNSLVAFPSPFLFFFPPHLYLSVPLGLSPDLTRATGILDLPTAGAYEYKLEKHIFYYSKGTPSWVSCPKSRDQSWPIRQEPEREWLPGRWLCRAVIRAGERQPTSCWASGLRAQRPWRLIFVLVHLCISQSLNH